MDETASDTAHKSEWTGKIRQLASHFISGLEKLTEQELQELVAQLFRSKGQDVSDYSEALSIIQLNVLRDFRKYSIQLALYPPAARHYFLVLSRKRMSKDRAAWFSAMVQREWSIDPPSLLDEEFPVAEVPDQGLTSALHAIPCNEAVFFRLIMANPNVARAFVPETFRSFYIVMDAVQNAKLRSEMSELKCYWRKGRVHATRYLVSGSRRELVADEDSDWDLMYELGPPEEVQRLRVVPTLNPGYVILKYPSEGELNQTTTDQPRKEWAFQVLFATGKGVAANPSEVYQISRQGNDASFKKPEEVNECVLSIPGAKWPSDAYRKRQRYQGYLSRSMVNSLASETAHWVQKGLSGSETEEIEWRISFSKLEAMLVGYLLSVSHRQCLIILKMCKHLLGQRAATVKTYQLKTCLMWQAEESAEMDVRKNVRAILTRLEEAVRQGHLPCYFWPEVNALGGLDLRQLQRLQAAVRLLIDCFPQLLGCAVATNTIHYIPATEEERRQGTFSRVKKVLLQKLKPSPMWEFWYQRAVACLDRLRMFRYLGDLIAERGAALAIGVPTMKKISVACQFLVQETLWAQSLIACLVLWPDFELLLRPRQSRCGVWYWVMDLSWFFHPSRRWYFFVFLAELDEVLQDQARLTPADRLPGLLPDFCRPADHLSAHQLQHLLLTDHLLLAHLLTRTCTGRHIHNVLTAEEQRNLRTRGVSSRAHVALDLLVRTTEDDVVDPWMPKCARTEREIARAAVELTLEVAKKLRPSCHTHFFDVLFACRRRIEAQLAIRR